MKKKTYISPQVKVIEFESANILAGSQGGVTETFMVDPKNEDDPPSNDWLDSNDTLWGD